MQAFVEYVVKGLVEHPEAVTVTPVERGGQTVYEVRLAAGDVGRVIGRQGMTINAIRSLLQAGSARKGIRCTMDIVEDKPAQ
jgi:predicted RNA-binding protein YlqC (UPF0109 family)